MTYKFEIYQIVEGIRKIMVFGITILTIYLRYETEAEFFTIFAILSFLVASSHQAVEFDFDNNTFKNYLWLLGLKLGKKQALPNIEYVLLREAHFSVKISDGLMDKPDIKYEVALVTEENAKIPLLYSFNYNNAQATAEEASYMFKVKIKNKTL